jgi:hypothetical protein
MVEVTKQSQVGWIEVKSFQKHIIKDKKCLLGEKSMHLPNDLIQPCAPWLVYCLQATK